MENSMNFAARGLAIAGLISAVLCVLTPALAQGPAVQHYPARTVRFIVPVPPGSPPDVVARVLSERLSSALGQQVLVDNRPGASGTIGLSVVAKSPADGYTFGVMSMPSVIAPSLLQNVPYDTAADFAPVRQVVWGANVLVVQSSSQLRSVDELIAAAKSKPGDLTFASGGNGTPAHMAGELLRLRSGADLRHIPFRGAPEGVSAVLSGQVTMMFAAVGSVAGHIQAGKLRALALSTPTRLASFPDVPTMAERGFPGFDVRDWQGIVAPAGTPREIVARISDEIAKIASLPEVNERFASMGMETVDHGGPEEFGALIRSELVKWGKVVRDAGIRAD
jgi:tripartite-type tricarboxylate transporter receptor subunit TctC